MVLFERQLALLTVRETQVMMLLLEGLTNKEIARQLGLSPETVRDHLRRLHFKLDVANKVELFAQARNSAGLPSIPKSA